MIILLRHGATRENEAEREILRGTDDPPLSAHGRAEIELAGEKICGKYPVVEIRTDRYQRDRETAAIVSEACGAPITIAPELEPYNIGELSGQAKEDFWPVLAYLFSHHDVQAPGGESVTEFLNEWAAYWWRVYDEYGGRDDAAVVLVVHGTEFRALNTILYGVPIPLTYEEHIKTGEVLVVN